MGLDIYAGTLTRYYSHNWKPLSSSGRRKTAMLSKKSRRTVNRQPMRKK